MMLRRWGTMALMALAVGVVGCDDDDETGPDDPTGIAIEMTSIGLAGGDDIDVLIDGFVEATVTSNGTTDLTVENLAPDTYTITLAIPSGCTAEPQEHVVTVEEGEMEEVAFTVTCGALG